MPRRGRGGRGRATAEPDARPADPVPGRSARGVGRMVAARLPAGLRRTSEAAGAIAGLRSAGSLRRALVGGAAVPGPCPRPSPAGPHRGRRRGMGGPRRVAGETRSRRGDRALEAPRAPSPRSARGVRGGDPRAGRGGAQAAAGTTGTCARGQPRTAADTPAEASRGTTGGWAQLNGERQIAGAPPRRAPASAMRCRTASRPGTPASPGPSTRSDAAAAASNRS